MTVSGSRRPHSRQDNDSNCRTRVMVSLQRRVECSYLPVGFDLGRIKIHNPESVEVVKAPGNHLDPFWSNQISVLLCEAPKPQNSMISIFSSSLGTLIYGFQYTKLLQKDKEIYVSI